ncbi:uncharacterized protein YMR317W-like isoform X2 [Xenia sp. Carnegie-2017]|uniref:uncharacterized protein YMR317W-like isoform X2 n=1 Tax=Xenia sp. Carnegie-2017 TaxID=2897299 RepID=UPI001F04BB18|nr:uncharacterized protein YMR317W-like isoform X2 [Xenia sp. Carnegie-2017]
MAANTEANLSSDFDIDEVINWDEQNYSSKGIEFTLPQINLSNNEKTPQNTTAVMNNMGTSQQTTLDGPQSSNTYFSSYYGGVNNQSNANNHGYPATRQTISPPNGLSFTTENISIPSIASTNSTILHYHSSLVGQENPSLTGQLCLTNNDVSPFDETEDLIEGPLDKIVDQIMDRQNSERISQSGSFDDDVPVITYSNRQADPPSRSVVSPNIPSPSSSLQNSPSPNTSSHQAVSSVNPKQPSRSIPVLPTNNGIQTNITSSLQNIPSSIQLSSLKYGGNLSQTTLTSHPNRTLQSPSGIVNTLNQNTTKCPAVTSSHSTEISHNQNILSAHTTYQANASQNMAQAYPSLMLKNPNQTIIQPSISNFSRTNTTSKPVWQNSSNALDDLIKMQRALRASSPNLVQTGFTSSQNRTMSSFPQGLTSSNGNIQSQNNTPLYHGTDIGTQQSPALFEKSTHNLNTPATSLDRNINSNHMVQFQPSSTSNPLQTMVTGDISNGHMTISVTENTNGNQVVQSPALTSYQNDGLMITKVTRTLSDEEMEALNSPRLSVQTTSNTNRFIYQNRITGNSGRNVMSYTQPQSVAKEQSMTKCQAPTSPLDSKSVFTLIASSPGPDTNAQTSLFKTEADHIISRPPGMNTIKITSPSLSAAGFKYPALGLGSNPSPKAVSMQLPRTTSVRLQNSPSSPNVAGFPSFTLTSQGGLVPSAVSSTNNKPMVFTLARGSNLKGLPAHLKDKKLIFLQQPGGQPIDTPKPQPVKIVFVSDDSVAQLVLGSVKNKNTQCSVAPMVDVHSQSFNVASDLALSSMTDHGKLFQSHSVNSSQDNNISDSPSSVNSVEIGQMLVPGEIVKDNNDINGFSEQKKRGRKKKDPNCPVKPLSTFQRFFQATQPILRQQNPQVTFTEISKTIKEMWEKLPQKEKKIYQVAWREDRAQYKKALEEYNAGKLDRDEVDGNNIMQEIKPVELKNDSSITVPAFKTDVPTSSTPTSPSLPPNIAAPRSTGKPLAMMAEMNKTKLATAKAAGTSKFGHVNKHKLGNGTDDSTSQVVKKKAKLINPIPKKFCIRAHCNNLAKTSKERGAMFCSDDCVMLHCRGMFRSWVEARRQALKATT